MKTKNHTITSMRSLKALLLVCTLTVAGLAVMVQAQNMPTYKQSDVLPVKKPVPIFRVTGIAELRSSMTKSRANIIPQSGQPVNPYAQGQGVVLTPAAPVHYLSGSKFQVRQVYFDETFVSLAQNSQNPTLLIKLDAKNAGRNRLFDAQFNKLQAGNHTYTLRVGTDLASKIQPGDISIINTFAQMGQPLINKDTNEIHFLFQYNASSSGSLSFSFELKPPGGYDGYALYHFHHVQLAQLD